MARKLFTEFPPVSTSQWEEVIKKDLKGADYDKKLVCKTLEGFSIRPYYRAEDIEKFEHLDNLPGAFPYVRGVKDNNKWLVRQGYCAWEDVVKANKEAVDGVNRGVESVAFCLDGNKEMSVNDMSHLIKDLDLNSIEINFEGCKCETPSIITAFLKAIEAGGYDKSKVKASFDFDPLRELTTTGNFCCSSYKERLRSCIDLVKDYPLIRVIGVEGYAFNDAGASVVQELAYAMSSGSEYLNILTDMGFSADVVADRIKFTLSAGSNYFMEIAKFRAARVLWANITQAYGCNADSSKKLSVHAVTSRWNNTVYDPYVNMLRSTTAAMSAALGGVDSLEVLPFDYAFRAPSVFSNRIARNTQIILKEESHFDKIIDPSAGSYFIENLTVSIAGQAWQLFTETENDGGFISAFTKGTIQDAIKMTSAKRDLNIATRRETLLGTNQYPNFNEKTDKDVTLDVVTRGKNKETEGVQIAQPLELYRGANAFETLRFTTETMDKTPKVFMLTFGNLAFCRARAQFACNFFAVAGFEVVDNNRFSTIAEGADAALNAKADIVVACSSDDEYTDAVPEIRNLIKDNAVLVVAGEPACKDALVAQGITNFISVKSNVLETLKQYQDLMVSIKK